MKTKLITILIIITSHLLHSHPPKKQDWQTYMGNNQRTANTAQTLTMPLHLNWTRKTNHPPKPAWTKPAKQDFWHRKTNLKAKITFDYTPQPVTKQNYLIIPSTTEDTIHIPTKRSGCGTTLADQNQIYFRHKHPATFTLNINQTTLLTKINRTGCWIIIIPESSSGCTCSFAIQASLALINNP